VAARAPSRPDVTTASRHPSTAETRPLRIAMISYYLPSESKIGVGYQVHALANELVRRGHTVDVFSPCRPVEGARYGHVHLPLTGPLRTFRFASVMRRQDLTAYDVLHAHGEDYWMWRRRVPMHVRTLHGSCFEEALRIRGVKERARMVLLGFTELLASLVADRTVLISPQTRRWTPWVRTVIPNGVDPARFHALDGVARRAEPTILFVGTWHGRKRGAELASVFAERVRPRVPGARLRMVTQDAPAELPAGVDVLGRLDDDVLADEYRRAWVFCLPSTYEGFGIPYAEAMMSGLPVVATPNVGARFVTDEGRFGVLAELDDLGDRLVEVLTDDDLRARLSTLARERSAEFDLDRVASAYERVYRWGRRG
jgi:phosphatidyl-myo-inositol alpha-mannosyltransferase